MDDILIAHATVVTMDSSNRILRDAAIAVREREIAAIGPTEVVSAEHPAREVIDARGMIALPGLVNGHIHMLTALYKGTMCGFGFERTAGEDMDLCGIATPDIMLAASRLSATEMLLSGITLANVAGDAAAFEVARQTAEALGQAGMKAFVQTMVADLFGLTDLSADAQLAEAEMLLREYQGKFEGRIRVAPSPGEAMATSLKTMRRLAALAEGENLIEHIHVFPRWPMGWLSWLLRGRSPLGLLKAGGLLNERLVAVHFLAAKRGDIAAVARAGASVVHCPSVWMNVGVGPRRWLPMKALHRAGVNIMIGTDSYGGWIEGVDMFTEMRNCILMSNFLYGADSLKPVDVLRMATINGARALGLEKETGSLEVGKRADIALLKFDRPPVQPSSDVPYMVVYGASRGDVQTVLVDGHIVVRNGRVLTLDECEAVTAAVEARAELYRRAGWELRPDGATPPATSWLERYPNRRLAAWGARFARLQSIWKRGERRQ
jgi:5-methylthioadenosine/S-adenosylhomocysteine deaminase